MTTATITQRKINQLFKMKGIEGEVIVNIDVKANNYKEVEQYQNLLTSALVAPENVRVSRHGNTFTKGELTVSLFFKKV